MNSKAILATAVACLCVSSIQSASADDLIYEWYTVANNGDVMPTDSASNCGSCHEDMASTGNQTSEGSKFNSYNQPAINRNGVVVFRARSRGGHGGGEGGSGHGGGEEGGSGGGGAGSGGSGAGAGGSGAGSGGTGGGESGSGGSGSGGMGGGSGSQPERGIYMRSLAEQGPLYMVFRRGGPVPQPNNTTTGKGGELATFNEFPSVPRIDAGSDTIATRGQSTPVWTGLVKDEYGNLVETKTGTSGIYVTSSHGMPATGASMLGDVYEYDASGAIVRTFPYFQVPVHGDVPAGTGFDQFPGSPAVTERTTIVFKGNFSVGGVGKTGVFYRDFAAMGGAAPIELVASSYTMIPALQPDSKPKPKSKSKSKPVPQLDTYFGSTAPPSAGGKYAVFAGYDNEQKPTKGGIYRARLGNKPIVLETVVQIGDPVKGADGYTFEVFGEAISVSSNGRHVLFWGGWGGKKTVTLVCPDEGNAAMQEACAGAPNTGEVPNFQGFFLRDMQTKTTVVIAKTGDIVDGRIIEDFVYWNFSGRVLGKGHGGEEDPEETLELARWRSTSFGAVSGTGAPGRSVIKARLAGDVDALLLRDVKPNRTGDLVPLLRTGDLGAIVDPEAPAGAVISALGIERDGFRGDWLAINVSMLVPSTTATAAADGEESEEETGWAGIYAAHFLDDDEVAP